MTPLLGTESPSAPVGAKSGGDRRAARSLLSCALWSGMGRLWRGMGGMVRPEPLSAHHPHQQQGLSGFHETRDPNHGFFVSLFTIVHDCSAKKYCSCASVRPRGARCGGCRPLRRQRGLWVFHGTRSRITAFYRVLRPSSGEKCRLVPPPPRYAVRIIRARNIRIGIMAGGS